MTSQRAWQAPEIRLLRSTAQAASGKLPDIQEYSAGTTVGSFVPSGLA